MERIPLSATHKSTLTQESLKGGVQPLARGVWGLEPPDPGSAPTKKIATYKYTSSTAGPEYNNSKILNPNSR